jgi:hypothetical protein
MNQEPKSKYKTGLYYKSCLYSDSNEWISGDQPGGKGSLVAAICINKAIYQIDVAIDGTNLSSEIVQKALIQVGIGFQKLGIPQAEQNTYKVLYQTANGTTLLPVIKKIKPGNQHPFRSFFERLLNK